MYDKAFFDRGIERRGTNCIKWDEGYCPQGCLSFGVADMDFCCADEIVRTVQERAGHGTYGYSSEDQHGARAFCDFWKRRHGLDLQPDEITMLPLSLIHI